MLNITFTKDAQAVILAQIDKYGGRPEDFQAIMRYITNALGQKQVILDEIKSYYENEEN